MKVNLFWKVFWFILKISFISFGGGNAIMPIAKRYSVEKYNWLTSAEFDEVVIMTNLLPGDRKSVV